MVTAEMPARRTAWPQVRANLATAARSALARAQKWRVHAAVPGLAGMGLVSAGLGLKFGAWAGLIAAGVFLLRVDSRL